MLKFVGINQNNEKITFPEFLNFEIQKEQGVPADCLDATFPYFENASSINKIILYEKDKVCFTGIVDEILKSKSISGTIVKFFCRNMFALLIDNEAIPGTFYNVTANMIFDRYIKLYGFESFVADNTVLKGIFEIEKGESVYDVLAEFCRIHYKSTPFLLNEKEISFVGAERENSIIFSDKEIKSENGIEYYSLECFEYPCKLISKVKVKTSENDFYETLVENKEAVEKGIVRQRCIDACNENTPMICAYTMIDNSNSQYEEYKVKVNELCFNSILEKCQIEDLIMGKIESLYIKKIITGINQKGAYSYISFKKER